jgi:hypothetical protein
MIKMESYYVCLNCGEEVKPHRCTACATNKTKEVFNPTYHMKSHHGTVILKCSIKDYGSTVYSSHRAFFYEKAYIVYPKKWRGMTISKLAIKIGNRDSMVRKIGQWK